MNNFRDTAIREWKIDVLLRFRQKVKEESL